MSFVFLGPKKIQAATPITEIAEHSFLRCLAKEEEHLHKTKNTPYRVEINAHILAMAVKSHLKITPKVHSLICRNPTEYSPSISFLKHYTQKGLDILEHVDEWTNFPPPQTLLYWYITTLQRFAPHASFLEKKYPWIRRFFEKLKYLEGEEMAVFSIPMPTNDQLEKFFEESRRADFFTKK